MTKELCHREFFYSEMPSPAGKLMLIASEHGLTAVLWNKEDRKLFPDSAKLARNHPVLDHARAELEGYFCGKRREFTVPLAPVGTPFQQSAWQALRAIPYGETRSYQQQAIAVGGASKTRAVGAANGRNPVSIIVPCHRVIGKSGQLTGFAGGLPVKQFLLEHEAKFA